MKVLLSLFALAVFSIDPVHSRIYRHKNLVKNSDDVKFSKATCPPGSVQAFSEDICWYFINVPLNFLNADKYCQGLGGHLASVHNAFDNIFLTDKARGLFTQSDAFIVGGNNLVYRYNWTWINNDVFDFSDWGTNEPANADTHNCLHVDVGRGIWFASDCFLNLPFVCQVAPGTAVNTTTPSAMTTRTPAPPTNWTMPPSTTHAMTTPAPVTPTPAVPSTTTHVFPSTVTTTTAAATTTNTAATTTPWWFPKSTTTPRPFSPSAPPETTSTMAQTTHTVPTTNTPFFSTTTRVTTITPLMTTTMTRTTMTPKATTTKATWTDNWSVPTFFPRK